MKSKPKKHNRKHMKWAAILAIVPLAALLWTILTYISDRPPDVLPQSRFVLLEKDALLDFVDVGKQKGVLSDAPFHAPRVQQDACYQELVRRFSPQTLHDQGNTVESAVFLAVTNAGRQPAIEVRLQGVRTTDQFHNLAPDETLLVCVKINVVGGAVMDATISSVELIPPKGFGKSLLISSIPPKSQMATLPGKPGFFLGSPQSAAKK